MHGCKVKSQNDSVNWRAAFVTQFSGPRVSAIVDKFLTTLTKGTSLHHLASKHFLSEPLISRFIRRCRTVGTSRVRDVT